MSTYQTITRDSTMRCELICQASQDFKCQCSAWGHWWIRTIFPACRDWWHDWTMHCHRLHVFNYYLVSARSDEWNKSYEWPHFDQWPTPTHCSNRRRSMQVLSISMTCLKPHIWRDQIMLYQKMMMVKLQYHCCLLSWLFDQKVQAQTLPRCLVGEAIQQSFFHLKFPNSILDPWICLLGDLLRDEQCTVCLSIVFHFIDPHCLF